MLKSLDKTYITCIDDDVIANNYCLLGQSSEIKMAAKKEEIIYRYFIILIDRLKYKKTKFKNATTLRGALGSN